MLPAVEVVYLPPDPSGYVRALDQTLLFETSAYTREDAGRTRQYRARAEIARLEANAENLEDFYASLAMRARIEPFNDVNLARVAQLVGKSNQFNLTTRRHTPDQLRAFADDPATVTLTLSLRDRFADHGLVSVLIAQPSDDALEIDTWLMSCRVIGRTVEAEMLAHLCRHATALGITRLRGIYLPTPKNAMVKDVYERFGFTSAADGPDGAATWSYDIAAQGPITNEFIQPWRPPLTQLDPVQDILRMQLGDDTITLAPDTRFTDLPGWDSVQFINFLFALEAQYGRQFDAGALAAKETVGEVLSEIG